MKLIVNGIEQEISSPPLTTLLDVLREELEITSPKAGCRQIGLRIRFTCNYDRSCAGGSRSCLNGR